MKILYYTNLMYTHICTPIFILYMVATCKHECRPTPNSDSDDLSKVPNGVWRHHLFWNHDSIYNITTFLMSSNYFLQTYSAYDEAIIWAMIDMCSMFSCGTFIHISLSHVYTRSWACTHPRRGLAAALTRFGFGCTAMGFPYSTVEWTGTDANGV